MVDITGSLDAATQQVLALLAQIRLSNCRFVQAQDIGAADNCIIAPVPNVANYGADLVLMVDIAAPNLTTSPKLTIQGLGTVPIQAADGSAPAIGSVAGKRMIGFSSIAGGGFAARLLGLAPADIGALLASYIANNFIITTPVTIQIGGVAPAAPASGYPNYFATLQAGFSWLSNYRIAQTGSVLFQYVSGKIPLGASIFLSHPDAQRVTVAGAPLLQAMPTTTAPLQMTGNSAAQRAADNATNLAYFRNIFATELALTGGAGIGISSSITLSNLLLTSDGTLNAQGGSNLVYAQGGLPTLNNVIGFGSGQYGLTILNGAAVTTTGTVGFFGSAGQNVSMISGSLNVVGPFLAYSSGGDGCNSGSGLLSTGSLSTCFIVARGNVGAGISGENIKIGPSYGSGVCASDYNAFGYFTVGGRIKCNGCIASNNSTCGWYSSEGGYIMAQNTQGAGNGTAFTATDMSGINRAGSTATGTTVASPAVGTVGNSNSLIV